VEGEHALIVGTGGSVRVDVEEGVEELVHLLLLGRQLLGRLGLALVPFGAAALHANEVEGQVAPKDAAVAGVAADDPRGALVGMGEDAGFGPVPPPVVDPAEQLGRVEVVVDFLLGVGGGDGGGGGGVVVIGGRFAG